MPPPTDEVSVRVTEPITKGCLILVEDIVDPEEMPRLLTSLRHIAGHEKFLIVRVGEGQGLRVYGEDDVKNALRSLVREEFDNLLKEIRARGN